MVANCRRCDVYEPESIRLYTLEDAEVILNRKKQFALSKKKSEAIYFLKQKLCGFVMLLIGALCPIFMDGDATFSLFAIPLGLWLLVTKKRVMDFR